MQQVLSNFLDCMRNIAYDTSLYGAYNAAAISGIYIENLLRAWLRPATHVASTRVAAFTEGVVSGDTVERSWYFYVASRYLSRETLESLTYIRQQRSTAVMVNDRWTAVVIQLYLTYSR